MIDLFRHPHRQMLSRSAITLCGHTHLNEDVRRNCFVFPLIQDGTPDIPHVCVFCSHLFFFFFSHFYFPSSGQAVVTGVVPSSPRFLPSIFIAHRVQQSHCSSIFHRVLLNVKLTLSRFAPVNWCTRKSPNEFIRVCTRWGSNSRN